MGNFYFYFPERDIFFPLNKAVIAVKSTSRRSRDEALKMKKTKTLYCIKNDGEVSALSLSLSLYVCVFLCFVSVAIYGRGAGTK